MCLKAADVRLDNALHRIAELEAAAETTRLEMGTERTTLHGKIAELGVFLDGAARMLNEQRERIAELEAEVEQLTRERRHLARIAWWFAEHEPGEPVPDWCVLSWRDGEPDVDEEELEESEREAAEAAEPGGEK